MPNLFYLKNQPEMKRLENNQTNKKKKCQKGSIFRYQCLNWLCDKGYKDNLLCPGGVEFPSKYESWQYFLFPNIGTLGKVLKFQVEKTTSKGFYLLFNPVKDNVWPEDNRKVKVTVIWDPSSMEQSLAEIFLSLAHKVINWLWHKWASSFPAEKYKHCFSQIHPMQL